MGMPDLDVETPGVLSLDSSGRDGDGLERVSPGSLHQGKEGFMPKCKVLSPFVGCVWIRGWFVHWRLTYMLLYPEGRSDIKVRGLPRGLAILYKENGFHRIEEVQTSIQHQILIPRARNQMYNASPHATSTMLYPSPSSSPPINLSDTVLDPRGQ